MTKKKKWLFSICIFIIIILILVKVLNIPGIILKKIYPKDYEELVSKYAAQNKVDPLLIYAMIKAESNFKLDAVSKSGAIGLMQLMEATAADTAKKVGIEYESSILYTAEINIMLGTKYYANLYDKYKNITLALTAYNAGTGNVDRWIDNGTIQKDGFNAENIPYRETNNYVRKILRDYEIYKDLYNK